MLLSEFDFPFDPTLVADHPILPRDQARLLVMERTSGARSHRRVADLPSLLQPGDLVVVNNTKVMPARVPAQVRSTGKWLDLLFVQDLGQGEWEVLIKGRFKPGAMVDFPGGGRGEIVERSQARTTLKVTGVTSVYDLMHAAGTMPLPPYIKREPSQQDQQWYQTMFAQQEGAIAAPTAGLHFTRELVEALAAKRIELAQVTLHVGPGTFRSVKSDSIEDHRMLAEQVDVSEAAVEQIRRVRLMLVSALVGVESLRAAYAEAVAQRYRFYSYGDAMLIGTGVAVAT